MTRVLLVDDDEMSRDMLSRRLIRRGFEVIFAVDGKQGVEAARREKPDIILMDMGLPVMDGWEATRCVYLHMLPMFHANGWGMPFAMTGMGVTPVGDPQDRRSRDPAPRRFHGVTVMCAAPAVVASVLEAAETWEGEIPVRACADHRRRVPP